MIDKSHLFRTAWQLARPGIRTGKSAREAFRLALIEAWRMAKRSAAIASGLAAETSAIIAGIREGQARGINPVHPTASRWRSINATLA